MKNKKYKLLIFDWDGTLINSEHCIVEAVQAVGRELGLSVPSASMVHDIIGISTLDSMRALFPSVAPEYAADVYRKHYFAIDNLEHFFDGVYETLRELQRIGYKLAIATNKSRDGLIHSVRCLKVENLFDAIRCGDDGFAKPHPDVLLDVLAKTAMNAQDALMIGDTIYDLLAGANAGVDALAVSYGVHSKEQLLIHKPVGCIDDIRHLLQWLA